MTIQSMKGGLAAIAAAATLLASLNSGSAMTLASSATVRPDASSQVEQVWYCRWNCGWGAPAFVGGLAAGAVIGAAVAPRPVYVAPAPVYYGDPCWRRWVGPYGGVHWRRVC